MEIAVQAAINALILASVYILVSLGFAFLFNMNGVLNLAHGSIYMVAGYVAYSLIAGVGLPHILALPSTVIIISAFGLFVERFCFRPFPGDFNRIVTISIALTVILTTTVNILIGTKQMAIPTFVEGTVCYGNYCINRDRFFTFIISIITLVLTVLFVNRTRWGQQMQAISQNRMGVSLLGININQISLISTAFGFALAALAGCIMGTLYNLSPFMGQSTLVKVLMVVMLAGAGSFGGIFIVGLILGALYGILPVFLLGASSDAVAIIIFMLLLLIKPQGFFGHEVEITENPVDEELALSRFKGYKAISVVICASVIGFLSVIPFLFSSYLVHIIILTFIYIIASTSLRAIFISGQFPLAHGAIMGIGAYLSGMTSKWWGWPLWVSIPVAAVVTTGISILFGYSLSRLRSLYYAMGSLFLGMGIIQIIAVGGKWTGSYSGLTGIPPLFGGSLTASYYFLLALVIGTCCILYRYEFSKIGKTLKAVSQSFMVAESIGINERGYRVLAIGVGSFFVALVGAVYGHYNMVITTGSFDLSATLWIVMYALIGGINNFFGPIIGTAILVIFPEIFRDLKMYSPYISAIILLLVVYFLPNGVVGLPGLIVKLLKGKGTRGVLR